MLRLARLALVFVQYPQPGNRCVLRVWGGGGGRRQRSNIVKRDCSTHSHTHNGVKHGMSNVNVILLHDFIQYNNDIVIHTTDSVLRQ